MMAGETYVLDDMGSRNGTFSNQIRVERPHVLRDGDMIQLGTETVLRFVAGVSGEPAPGSPKGARKHPRGAASTAEIEEEKLEKELAQARKVQMTMVPPNGAMFDMSAAQFVGSVCSASFAAGDLWTHVETGSKLMLLVADVTGHGVGPAMITTVAKSCLDTVLLRSGEFSIEQAFDTMNRVILGTSEQNLVMTAFAAQIDPELGQLAFCSAGHIPQVLVEGAARGCPQISLLSGPMTAPLGQSADSTYRVQTRGYDPGDRLVLFTDGLPEVRSPSGAILGNRRLHGLLLDNAALQPKALLDVILAEAERFAGGPSFGDDLAVVVARLQGSADQSRPKTSPGFAAIRDS
jgi:serine phosphatase RsbU (regulator of sigma subunit)